ncbi:MAG: DUF1330 domain-containing protein [Betaproteobacteria bacterium]
MSAFVIADVDVTDPVGFETYRQLVAPIVAAAGGAYRVRGGAFEVLEGDYQPRRLIVLEFESMAAARAWYHSDAYAPARALRQRSAATNAILVEGL